MKNLFNRKEMKKIGENKFGYHDIKKKKENATENVASMVMQILADYVNQSVNNYLNFSVNDFNAEDAVVASMVMQRSEKPCPSRLLGSNPSHGESSALSKRGYINKWKCFSFNGKDRKRRTNFNFLSLIFISLLMIFLLAPGVLSLGITPGRTTFNYEAGLEKEKSFAILNNENKDMQVMLAVYGELKDSVKLHEALVDFDKSESSKQFNYKLKIDKDIGNLPGLHSAEVVALEIPKANLKGAYVGATVAVASQIYVYVPYPGKYLDADLNIMDGEENNTATFIVPVINRGKVGIGEARALIDIHDILNRKIATVESDYHAVAPGQRSELSGKWNVNVSSGNYIAKVTLLYDGESRQIEKQFAIGVQSLVIGSILVNNFRLGEVAKLQILVENKWSKDMQEVFANLLVFDDSSQVMADVKSPTEKIPALSQKELIAYWDTVGVKEGEYNGKLMVKYDQKSTDKNLILKISQNNLDVIGVGYAINPNIKRGFDITTILIVLIILLVIINLSWLVFFRLSMKRKDEKKSKK